MHDELVETLRKFLTNHGASFDDEKRRLLRGQLADLSTLERGRAAIVVAAAEEGVPRLLRSTPRKEAAKSIASLAAKLASRLHVVEPDATWAIRVWAAALGLIDVSEISKPAPQVTTTARGRPAAPPPKMGGQSPVAHARAQWRHARGWLTRRRMQIVASIRRVVQVSWRALKILLVLFIGVGVVAGLAMLFLLNEPEPRRPEGSVPIARNEATRVLPPETPSVTAEVPPVIPPQPRRPKTETTPGLVGTVARMMLTRNLPRASSEANEAQVWGERGSLPHSVALIYAQILRTQGQPADNELRRQSELAHAQAKLKSLLSSQEGRHVRTRMAVADATDDELILNADVSWGWPTEDPHSFSPKGTLEVSAPRLGLVRLVSDPLDPSETFSLRFGRDVPTNLASRLRWNDKVLVEFDIRRVLDEAPSSNRPVRVQVEKLKFIAPEFSFRWTDAWPSRGTFPHQVSAFASWSYRERRMFAGAGDFESFLAHADRTLRRGRAYLNVERVTESTVELKNDVTSPEQGLPGMVYLVQHGDDATTIKIPVAAIGRDRASRLTKDSSLLFAFDVVGVEEGTTLVRERGGSRTTAGVKVLIKNLRLVNGG